MKGKALEDLWTVQVESYAGYRGEERPLRFRWGERSYSVAAIEDQWFGPEELYFRIKTSDGDTYILRRTFAGAWTVESFRRS